MTWKKFYSRQYGAQYTEVALKCFGKEAGDLIPKHLENHCFLPENENQAYYCDLDEWKEFEKKLIEKYASSHEKLDEFVELFYSLGNKYVEISKELGAKDKLSAPLKDYERYLKALIEYCTFLWVAHVASEAFSKELLKLIDKYLSNKSEEIIEKYSGALLKPSEKATIVVLQEKILAHKKGGKSLDDLFEKYKWMPCLDIHHKPWTREDFEKFARDIKEEKKESLMNFDKAVNELNISEDDRNAFLLGKRISYLRDKRDDFRRQGVYFIQPFFEKIAREMNLGLNDFTYLTHKEVIDFLKEGKKVSKEVLDERRKGFLIYRKEDFTYCLTGKEIEKGLKLIGFISEKPKENQAKGICAMKGLVKGTAKIVKGVQDLAKVNEGDILIAVTTHPDYVSAMHKAKAIVTDEGGMLCHAAIVSREMKKPCIVGTGNATKLFKDGETVLVDAEKGIAKQA